MTIPESMNDARVIAEAVDRETLTIRLTDEVVEVMARHGIEL